MTVPSRLRAVAGALKALAVRVGASTLYYSGALAPLRALAERYQLRPRGEPGFPLRRRPTRFVQILTLHSVNDDRDLFLPGLPTGVFARQVSYLAKHYRVCDANELKSMLSQQRIPERAIVITFDDGYRDVLLNAYPILRRHNVPATVFLPAAHIGTDRVLWHDRVAAAFRTTRRPSVPAYGAGDSLPLDTPRQKIHAFRETVRYLRTLDAAPRDAAIDRLCADLDVAIPADAAGLMLDWDEVRSMQAGGMSFGSHTVTHPILSRLPEDAAAREIAESKRLIEAELGVPVRAIAYPNGTRADFTEANKEAARKAGYDCALTTIFGVNAPGEDLFELRRGGPWDEHLPSFALRLAWQRLTA